MTSRASSSRQTGRVGRPFEEEKATRRKRVRDDFFRLKKKDRSFFPQAVFLTMEEGEALRAAYPAEQERHLLESFEMRDPPEGVYAAAAAAIRMQCQPPKLLMEASDDFRREKKKKKKQAVFFFHLHLSLSHFRPRPLALLSLSFFDRHSAT